MEVMIDGVEYVRKNPEPNGISIWFMHDNHTFTKLYGTTLDEVIENANKVEASSSYGMLCPISLLIDGNDLCRVGKSAHGRSSKDPKDKWNDAVNEWRKEVEKNQDVMRLLAENKESA